MYEISVSFIFLCDICQLKNYHLNKYDITSFLERSVFATALLMATAPIWTAGTYFVTGDGPCHTYNAAVLLDWLMGRNSDFYAQFYTINTHFEPNWWTHAWLMLLQTLFEPALAEKIFLSFYVFGFGFGLRFLIRQINPENVFLSSVGLLFCWHHLLQMGFFNYSFSFVGMFWLVGFWLHCRPRMSAKQGILMALGWILVYSMHPIGLAFSALAIGLSLMAEAVVFWRMSNINWMLKNIWKRVLMCFCTALPAMFFAADYVLRKNWNHSGNSDTFSSLLDNLGSLSVLTLMNRREHSTTNLVIILLIFLAIFAIISRFRSKKIKFSDFWLVFTGIALWQYFSEGGAQALELLMPLRLQLLPWFGLFLWVASGHFQQILRWGVSFTALIISGLLLSKRIPAHQAASRMVKDWISVANQIPDRSVVMVVNYNFNGTDENGKQIGDAIWMFNHAADYLGAERSGIIMSDNYEALLRYFPLIWRIEGDMYNRTAIDGVGFEDRPPSVDLLGFPKRSVGRKMDYVLILDQNEADREHERGKELMRQLEIGYKEVCKSEKNRAVLYRLR
jgi:hypothetical protein